MKKIDELATQLTQFGLSQKEGAVYIAMLELGRGTVSRVSRSAGINRTTGYDILSSLAAQGLVRISGKEPKQEYVAESPDNFLKFIENKAELLNEKIRKTQEEIRKAHALVPVLKTIQKIDDRPQIKFYEGVDGMKQVYEDTLTSSETIRAFATVEDVHEAFGSYFPKYYKRRAGKGIAIRAIFPDTPLSTERTKYDSEESRESMLVPKEKYTFHPEINIYDNKMMIASWREKLGIIIESAEIADAMKKIFELAWAEAKRLDKGSSLGTQSESGV